MKEIGNVFLPTDTDGVFAMTSTSWSPLARW
jgi:hypothetical protein